MSKQHHKYIRALTGYFLGWGDDLPLHRYLKLATENGDRLVKVAKSLRPQIQDWQPGIEVNLLTQERIDRSTGDRKIKVKKLLTQPRVNPPLTRPVASTAVAPTKIQICQGSSCRRRGSENICQAMQAYFDRHDLTDPVEIETVKCLHQCKAAPHAIVTSPAESGLPGKTHYRQVQPTQVQLILAKHFPVDAQPESIGANLIEQIGDYFQHYSDLYRHDTPTIVTFPS